MKSLNQSLNRYVVGILLVLLLLLGYLQLEVTKSTEALKQEELKKSEAYAGNIAAWIVKQTEGNISNRLKQDKQFREQLNEVLETFLTPQYEYIFVLGKDKKGNYHFLLDGSKEEKEEFGMIFMPQSSMYDLAYESRTVKIAKQKDEVKGVWISLLYPIVVSNHTQALLVLDLSQWYGEELESFNSPLLHLIRLMQLLFFAMILFLLLMLYRYYKLHKEAMEDALTGAHTKLYMEEFFNRHSIGEYYALLVDIDEFKEINSAYGYENGDILLRAFVEVLKEYLPFDSHIVRIGGAEFFIFFEKRVSLEKTVTQLMESLREKRYLVNNEVVKLSVSITAIDTPPDTVHIQSVIHVLDEALLKVKNQGKNDLLIIDTTDTPRLKHQHIDYTKEAMEEGRLVCLYQPIYKTEGGQVEKYETLVRLVDKNDPTLLISPAEFIPQIRGTSQYIRMSKMVLQAVFENLERYPELSLSVNLDMNDLYSRDMMQMISDFLYQNKALAPRLIFEILETGEIEDYAKVNFIFMQLREYGSKIAIDDFGSGYSNYHYLIKLNIDIVKIDGSMISALEQDEERAKMVVSSMVSISHALGYETVAEFVSTEKIWKEVVALGITYAQGYYLGKPDYLENYMAKANKKLTDD